jgi:hypothetical protein
MEIKHTVSFDDLDSYNHGIKHVALMKVDLADPCLGFGEESEVRA